MAEFAAEQGGRLGEVRTFRRGFGGDTANFIIAVARMAATISPTTGTPPRPRACGRTISTTPI